MEWENDGHRTSFRIHKFNKSQINWVFGTETSWETCWRTTVSSSPLRSSLACSRLSLSNLKNKKESWTQGASESSRYHLHLWICRQPQPSHTSGHSCYIGPTYPESRGIGVTRVDFPKTQREERKQRKYLTCTHKSFSSFISLSWSSTFSLL